jgi:hypothetical protein
MAAVLTGCSFKSIAPGAAGAPSAAFTVSPVTLVRAETTASDPYFGFPTQKSYHLKACLQDAATPTPLAGQAVSIERPLGKTEALSADNLGCIYWTERWEFMPLANEHFILAARTLAVGTARTTVTIAFNPWLDNSAGFVGDKTIESDLTPLPEAGSEKVLRGMEDFSPSKFQNENLVLETLSLSPLEQGASSVTYAVGGRIKATRLNEEGQSVTVNLRHGSLQAKLIFFEVLGTNPPLYLGQSGTFRASIEHGSLEAKATAGFEGQHREGAQVLAVLSLSPPEGDLSGVLPLEVGLPLKTLRDSASGPPSKDAPQLARSLTPPSATSSGSFETPEGSKGEFTGERHFDPGTSLVKIGFSALVPVRDSLTNQPIARRLFEVLVSENSEWPAGQKGKNVLSLSDGSLRIEDSIEYSDLASEETYLRRFLLMRGAESPYENTTRAVEVYVNPWQRGELFYKDALRQGTPSTLPVSAGGKLLIPNYTAVFRGREFQIENNLQLTTLRFYDVRLKPTVLRSNFAGSLKPLPIRPGTKFQLKAVWTGSEPATSEAGRFIAAFEKGVEVDDQGEINTRLVLATDFTQQARLDLRTQVAFTLSSDSDLQRGSLVANFNASPTANDTLSGDSLSSTEVAGKMPSSGTRVVENPFGKAYATDSGLGQSPIETLAKYWRGYGPLQTITLHAGDPASWTRFSAESGRFSPLAQRKLQEWLRSSVAPHNTQDVLTSFCSSFVNTSSFGHCNAHPEDYFHLSHFTLADSVQKHSATIARVSSPSILLGKAYFNEILKANKTSHVDKDATHWVNGVGAKVGLEFNGNGASAHTVLNRELEWYRIEEASIGDNQRSRKSVAKQIQLSQEEVVLQFTASLRHCILVRPLRFALEVSRSKGSALESVLVCGEPKPEGPVEESWYSLKESPLGSRSVHSDAKSALEQVFTKLLRGKQSYDEFTQLISDETRYYDFQKIEPFFDGDDTLNSVGLYTPRQLNRLALDGGLFPGVLSMHESSSLQWRETQINRNSELCFESFSAKGGRTDREKAAAAKYCRCLFESAARIWDHGTYLKAASEKKAELTKRGVVAQCQAFSKGEE